jgi:nucleotide-binding universal stress UspA family protein
MNQPMKIAIAYDGSPCADAALRDLGRAGLPTVADALVISVADVFLPPPINEEVDNTFPMYVPDGIRRAHKHAARELRQADDLAKQASNDLRTMFPRWNVSAVSCAESPALGVIWKASEFNADLIVAGAQGHSDFGGRLILGSVSQRILYEARNSVRIGRGGHADRDHVRIIIGADGSPNFDDAVAAVAARTWPADTEAQLVTALDTVISVTPDRSQPSVTKWIETDNAEDLKWLREFFEASAVRLSAAGLKTSTVVKKGDPKQVLVAVAEEWKADSIFLGVKGVRGVERFLIGSVSSAVAARAHCSVEVVRPKATSMA